MSSYSNAGRGLGTIYTAQILGIIGAVLLIVGVLVVPLLLVAAVLALISLVMNIVGLNTASQDHPGYKSAMHMAIVGVILSVISNATAAVPVLGAILSVISMVVSYLMVAHVCDATGELVSQKGDGDIAVRGAKVKRLYLGCTIVTAVCTIASAIPGINVVAAVVAVIAGIVQLVAYILYLSFLSKGKASLLA